MNNIKSIKKYNAEGSNTITVLSKNRFKTIAQEIKHHKFSDIKSYFTDEEAKHICLKMSNNRIRHFGNLFLTNAIGIDKITLKYQIHYLANKALSFYGGKILSFIYELKQWTKKNPDVEVLNVDRKKIYDYDTNFPKLTIQSFGSNNTFIIQFKRAYERPFGSYTGLNIKNNSRNTIAEVSINGQLITDFENCIPIIAIFKACINGEYYIYSGYDDDVCDICQRKLEDPISIKYGRGPTCRNNNGIP